ncbi:FAD-binding domain-containing protein [Massarina eburnea CBS 473.64]|uniref:FAD-binding domain-containing protein n=1 Tax=Massarina eburnea CBS 473.64 TaxID=1395130 RepID=A0A6A6RP58_9PLEO|nr:FAD-binding domain-containing protein [Massarina eburnea CBS 473.64]
MAFPTVASACCLALSSLFGNKTFFPSDPAYNSSLTSYFSLQEATVHPQCILSPETTNDVSLAVKTLTGLYSDTKGDAKKSCRFAIRSGGHAVWAGAANIKDGVTLDLRSLHAVQEDSAKKTVSIGAGGTWDLVYSELDPKNLSVNGGRTAGVGIGGLSTGGGISYFGTRHGWTADTIVNFEVVLANGTVVHANENENADLLWALRGGNNNFGVVTRIDMQTFEQGPFFGGFSYHPPDVWVDEVKEFVSINDPVAYDEYAHLALTWGFSATSGLGIPNQLEYTKPIADPPIFAKLRSLPALVSSFAISNVTQLSRDLRAQATSGQRIFWNTLTFVSAEAAVNATFIRFNESHPSIAGVSGVISSLTLEPLPPALYARHPDMNALGFDRRENLDQSLVIALLTVSYASAADDQTVEKYGRALMDAINEDAKKLNASDPYLYLNYAAPYQDPISSYTHANVRHLRKIAAKWDPHGTFQCQVPGGFKLFDT